VDKEICDYLLKAKERKVRIKIITLCDPDSKKINRGRWINEN